MRTLGLAALALVALAGGAAAQNVVEGPYRLGYRIDAPPFAYERDGRPAGYAVEICEVLAADIGTAFGSGAVAGAWTPVPAAERLKVVPEGRVDVLCGAMTVTLQRRETMSFSIPIFLDGITIAVRADADADLLALAGEELDYDSLQEATAGTDRVLGVLGETTTEAFLETYFAQGTAPEVRRFDSHYSGFDALEAGEIDLYAVSSAIGQAIAVERGGSFVMSPDLLSYERIAIALQHGDEALRLAVDRTLSRLYLTGEIRPIYERHFGPATAQAQTFFLQEALP